MKRTYLIIILSVCLLFSCSADKKAANKKNVKQDYTLNAMMIDAATALSTDNINLAESLYTQVLDKDKNNAVAMYYLSNIAFRKMDIQKSISYGKQAVKVDGTNIWYKLQLSEIYLTVQKYDEAADMFEQVVKQEPEVIEYWQQLVNIYHVKSDRKGELSALDRMEKRFGVSDLTGMLKYNLYMEKNETSKAEAELLELTKVYPHQSKYWSILAEMSMKQKDYDKALEYYRKVEQADPDNELLNFTFANYYLVKKNDDSLFYYLQKAVAQPEVDFKTKMNIVFTVYQDKVDTDSVTFRRFFSLLETMRQTSDTANCQLWSMLNLGYMRQMNFVQAAYSAEKSIELGCVSFELYTNWLYASSTFSDSDKLIEIADKAIETYPEQPLPYLFKGVNLELKNEYNAAIEVLTSGLNRAGRDNALKEDFYMNLGDCYHALGQSTACFKNYDEVLKLNPDNYTVLNNYAYYLSLEKRDLDRALEYIERVMNKFSDNLTFVDTYAWVLYQRGEYAKAKSVMDKVTAQRPYWGETMSEHYEEILKKVR